MGSIVFRHYRDGDDNQLADLYNRSFQANGPGLIRTPKNWNWRYAQSPDFEPEMIQIAEDIEKNIIVGSVHVSLVERVIIDDQILLNGEINDVACLPGYTRQGIAKRLLKNAIKYMKKKKCDISILTADYSGFPRKKLYLKEGYRDYDREKMFVQFPNILNLIHDFYGFAFLAPVFLILSYLPRLLYRLIVKSKPFFNDVSYEIIRNKSHFKYMDALNRIIRPYYVGFHPYTRKKYMWARINTPSKRYEPTYIILKKKNEIIGGASFNTANIYGFNYGLKFKIGIVHEIFLDKKKFTDERNLHFGYTYLLDKLLKGAKRRFAGGIIVFASSLDTSLHKALKAVKFLSFKGASVMIKILKKDLKIEKLTKPLYIPTHVSLSIP
ncbi:MAG: GNAT family N-acetyltransferase [Candidatus Lokiarchaeota archaeon]|nr:GNAT family N-acetyltransferase [Candidatus Lokiarchaeota archaeon]